MKQTALLFIKPHGNTERVRAFVKKELASYGISVILEGHLTGPEIAKNGTIDRHYASIGRYAMFVPAAELVSTTFTPEVAAQFEQMYGISAVEAVSKGILLNAAECMKAYRMAPERVSTLFDEGVKDKKMLKIAPGCYTVLVPSHPEETGGKPVILINGFYLKMRAEYVEPKAEVTWLVLQWKSDKLSWADFRGKVLGVTDPTKAHANSIRAKLLRYGPCPSSSPHNSSGAAPSTSLGLSFTPSVSANCVHGSASPLEALNERLVWVGGEGGIAADVYGKYLIGAKGLPESVIRRMLTNAKVDGKPIFDIVEDMDSEPCAKKLVELASKL